LEVGPLQRSRLHRLACSDKISRNIETSQLVTGGTLFRSIFFPVEWGYRFICYRSGAEYGPGACGGIGCCPMAVLPKLHQSFMADSRTIRWVWYPYEVEAEYLQRCIIWTAGLGNYRSLTPPARC